VFRVSKGNPPAKFRVDSTGNTLVGEDLEVGGNIRQGEVQNGAVKAAVRVNVCGGAVGGTNLVTYQMNTVNNGGIVVHAQGEGRCSITFPFAASDRSWSVTTWRMFTTSPIGAECAPGSPSSVLNCARWDLDSGNYDSGPLMVTVF